jgi:hypothetical protein
MAETGFKKTGRGEQLGIIVPDPQPESKPDDRQAGTSEDSSAGSDSNSKDEGK